MTAVVAPKCVQWADPLLLLPLLLPVEQDAHEFFVFLLDGLHEELAKWVTHLFLSRCATHS